MTRLFLAAFLAFSSFSMAATAQTQAEIEKIVADYIAKNGKALAHSIETYLAEEQKARVSSMVAQHNLTSGPADAPVVMIEFSDFECPFCARAQGTLQQLRQKYKGKIKFVFKHLPLESIHPNATPAAVATQAANLQGKGWEFANALWTKQDKLSDALYQQVAADLKLDMKKFNADRASEAVLAQVQQDMADASAIGARGTPFFMVNGETISGAQPLENFEALIQKHLK